jgi:hypothetical protein
VTALRAEWPADDGRPSDVQPVVAVVVVPAVSASMDSVVPPMDVRRAAGTM